MDQIVYEAASAVGCDGVYWEFRPGYFAQMLLDKAKRHARFLKSDGLVKSHNEALEVVAKGAGFPHWHAFNELAQKLIETFNYDVHSTPIKEKSDALRTLIPAFFLMFEAEPFCPPTLSEQEVLSNSADKLAQACSAQKSQVLDMIAKMNGSDTWDILINVRPENTTEPLYTFVVDQEGNGRFEWSEACAVLVENQDSLFQQFDDRSDSEKIDFERNLEYVLQSQPDFLEGLLAKADLVESRHYDEDEAKTIYKYALEKADELIPKGFKGEISWYEISNRFYHRLMYGAMVLHATTRSIPKALMLARKQLRYNKSDNLGVRFWLPLLLIANGEGEKADKSIKAMYSGVYTDPQIELIKAIWHFYHGRYHESAESLYLSVFMYPPMRHIVNYNSDLLSSSQANDKMTRTIIPDVDGLLSQMACIVDNYYGIEKALGLLLNNPLFIKAEQELAKEFHKNWRVEGGSIEKWRSDIKNKALMLSRHPNK